MSADSQLLELTAFIKSMREQQARQASVQQALSRAREAAVLRQQFRPLAPEPVKPVKLRL
jgi:hypothetical protein